MSNRAYDVCPATNIVVPGFQWEKHYTEILGCKVGPVTDEQIDTPSTYPPNALAIVNVVVRGLREAGLLKTWPGQDVLDPIDAAVAKMLTSWREGDR